MCRRVPSEVRVLTWYRSQACGTFLEHSGSMRSLPEHSGTFLESFLGRFHRTQACGTFPEHSSKASSGGSTGLRRAERSWNIPRKLPRELPQDSGMRNVPGTFRNIPRTYGIGRTHPVLHRCSLSSTTDPIPSIFFSLIYHVGTLSTDSVRCMESAIPGRQHHIPSDL